MRSRDIGVSVVAVAAAFLALQGTPDVSVQLRWYVRLPSQSPVLTTRRCSSTLDLSCARLFYHTWQPLPTTAVVAPLHGRVQGAAELVPPESVGVDDRE